MLADVGCIQVLFADWQRWECSDLPTSTGHKKTRPCPVETVLHLGLNTRELRQLIDHLLRDRRRRISWEESKALGPMNRGDSNQLIARFLLFKKRHTAGVRPVHCLKSACQRPCGGCWSKSAKKKHKETLFRGPNGSAMLGFFPQDTGFPVRSKWRSANFFQPATATGELIPDRRLWDSSHSL